jgi:hypothetical protein
MWNSSQSAANPTRQQTDSWEPTSHVGNWVATLGRFASTMHKAGGSFVTLEAETVVTHVKLCSEQLMHTYASWLANSCFSNR